MLRRGKCGIPVPVAVEGVVVEDEQDVEEGRFTGRKGNTLVVETTTAGGEISAKIPPEGVVTASAALAVIDPAAISGTFVASPPKVIQALGKGIVNTVVTIGGDPPTATKLNVTTD